MSEMVFSKYRNLSFFYSNFDVAQEVSTNVSQVIADKERKLSDKRCKRFSLS